MHIPTVDTISGQLVVKYNKEPMIPLYMVSFTEEPGLSISNFELVPIGVSIGLAFSI